MKNVWLWWSSGKDSAWALKTLLDDPEFTVTGLVTSINTSADRVAMHAVRHSLLRAQSQALGIPLHIMPLPYPCPNGAYETAAADIIGNAEREGVTHMAFGDLFLEDIRRYREGLLADSSIEPLFPLWGRDTTALAHEMIDGGVTAWLTCVDPKVMPVELVGRSFDHDLLADLPKRIDPCGENGEFHTFVSAAPFFDTDIPVQLGERVERDGFWFADFEAPVAL
ncbi:MAG: ATP-binding protein [Woeseiaceae bacterium]